MMFVISLGLWGCEPPTEPAPGGSACDPCSPEPTPGVETGTDARSIHVSPRAGAPIRQPAVARCFRPSPQIALNEVSPSNATTLFDSDAESVDWVELVNADVIPVDLAGWTLSDDPDDEPDKWTFPAVSLEPGEHLLVYASGKDRSRVVGSWETRIDRGHTWRYLEVEKETDPGWFLPGFDDREWDVGPSGFGRGDGDDATDIDTTVAYVRTEVEVEAAELADLTALVLHVDFDDGFVAYLNGTEIAREAMGLAGSGPPEWDAWAWYSNEARLPQGQVLSAYELDPGLLVPGMNTLALEVRDRPESGDLSLIPFLSLGFTSERGAGPSPLLVLPERELHTSFKLKSSGETLALFDPDACRVDELAWVPLRADESVGRQPDGTGPVGVFLEPTPGAPNTTESRPGFATTPRIDPPSGLLAGGTTATVTAGSQAEIHLAWGGAEPTRTDDRYTGPLDVGGGEEALVLRARAWEDGLWPSRIATATWGFASADPLLTVSVATDPANLFDEALGIYTDDHATKDGWRRAAHFAAWEPDGTLAFAVEGSVQIHGGSSRRLPQKNLELTVGGVFGDDEAIAYPVYPDHAVTSFERLVLRGGGGDWLGCWTEACKDGAMLRDALMQALAEGTGIDHMGSRPARVYLNGEYWGLYFVNEKGDAHYVDSHHGEDEIDLLKNEAIPVQGDQHGYLEMIAWMRDHDLADPAHYAHAQSLVDVEQLQSYLALQVFYANTDWPGNNIKFWRPRHPGGRWRWMLFGTDFGLGLKQRSSHDTLAFALATDGDDWPNPPWSTELFRLLLASPEFSDRFVNRYATLLNTSLAPERTVGELHALASAIEAEIPRQAARWGGDEDAWAPEVGAIERWLTERPERARQHLAQAFGLEGTWTLSLDADPPGSGTFELEGVMVDGPFVSTWFRGLPVTLTAHPAPGYVLDGWSDPSLPTAATVTLDPASPELELTGRFR